MATSVTVVTHMASMASAKIDQNATIHALEIQLKYAVVKTETLYTKWIFKAAFNNI